MVARSGQLLVPWASGGSQKAQGQKGETTARNEPQRRSDVRQEHQQDSRSQPPGLSPASALETTPTPAPLFIQMEQSASLSCPASGFSRRGRERQRWWQSLLHHHAFPSEACAPSRSSSAQPQNVGTASGSLLPLTKLGCRALG